MIIHEIEQRSQEWHDLRQGKITGTTLGDILGTPKAYKKAFYETVAERLSIESSSDENPMMRGARLEEEAILLFCEMTGLSVENVGLTTSDLNEFIASSPDGLILNVVSGKYEEAVELKCLGSGKHVQAWIEGKIPEEYDSQILQYFIVNDDLQKLYFVFYDPRITIKKMFWIVVKREELAEQIEVTRQKEVEFIEKVDKTVTELLCQYEKQSTSKNSMTDEFPLGGNDDLEIQ